MGDPNDPNDNRICASIGNRRQPTVDEKLHPLSDSTLAFAVLRLLTDRYGNFS